jgi:hypothetical protein
MAQRKRRGPPPGPPRPGIFDNRTRLVALGLVLFAVVLLLWGTHKTEPAAPPSEEESASAHGGGGSPGTGFMGQAIVPVASGTPVAPKVDEPPPVIDEIDLEKTEVCAGEENLVTVKAHTINGTDPFLHYVVDGNMGQQVPLTLWTADNGQVLGKHTVTVFGRGNVATTVPVPEYTVKNCRPTYLAAIQQRVRSNTWSDFDFNARVVGVPRAPTDADRQHGAPPPPVPKPFKAISYSWDYGDGVTETTMGPITEHNYEGRPQQTLYSYFVLSVTIHGAKKEEVATGRAVLPLLNPSFEALAEKKLVQLLISLDPRFPQIGPDGKVTQHVRIWHNQPLPVTIDKAVLTKYFRHGAGETTPQQVDVGSLLGTTSIPPGKDGITTTVVLDPQTEEEVFSKTWDLDGSDAEGNRATGTFSVMLPPPKPESPDAGLRVFDPIMTQKILMARQILGKDVVDDEDIWALERQGAFANIKADPAAIAAARQAEHAAAMANGFPSPQPMVPSRGPPVPINTAQQAAQPGQGTGPAGSK